MFFPNQRWMSEGEPELGVGVVTEVSNGRVRIHFSISEETRLYATEDAPLRRVVFKAGETITDSKNNPFLIELVHDENDLILYVGKDNVLSEADLGDVKVKHGVEDRLLMGDIDSLELFSLRRKTLENDYKKKISPVNGFIGGRIDLIPHQLYIANEVSSRHAPRVLLSDQVGLGKTIEACLIIHRLLLSGRASRVLILVPDALLHQWFVELLRRFNLWFHIFDEERCTAIEKNAPDGNPFLDNQLIICSTSFISESQNRTKQVLGAEWDMLVVDEAHHLEWSIDSVSTEYAIVELLSKIAKGLLLLTATPEQFGVESHFARLRLLNSDRYVNYDTFKNESQDNTAVANIVSNLYGNKTLDSTEINLLATLFSKERINDLGSYSQDEVNDLIEDLLDQHGPGRVVFRNTRSAMKGFPKRIAHLVSIEVGSHNDIWIEGLTAEYMKDMGLETEASKKKLLALKTDPRVNWLLHEMEKLDPSKVLLICKSKEKVLALERALQDKASFKIGVFHEDLTIVQRDRNAAWFSEKNGARLLLCSEIGSEGRNFQFADHLILFDLPINPELLEQRIGRLDRIGQKKDINIHVPFLKGSPQEVLVKWFHEGLNAFEENIEAGNQIGEIYNERLLELALNYAEGNSNDELETLLNDVSTFHKELKYKLSKGRDKLLEYNSFRPIKSKKIIKYIKEADVDMSLEYYMTRVFESFAIEMEDLAPRTYLLHPSKTNVEAFPSVPDEGVSITFDRKKALNREDLSFVSWDHPMVSGAIDMILSLGAGSASFGMFKGPGSPGVLLELLFVLETSSKLKNQVNRFLPNTPLRVVVNHLGQDVTTEYTIELMDKNISYGSIDNLIENETMTEIFIPKMIESATKIAEKMGKIEISKGLERMAKVLDHEIARLETLRKTNNHVRTEEVQLALDERDMLSHVMKEANIRMDALLLIQKS